MKVSQIRFWLATSALALLAACGGGGGGGGGSAPVTSAETFQLRAAYVNYLTDTRSLPFNVTGTNSDGVAVTGTGTATQGRMSATTFEGQPALAKTSTVTGTLIANGRTWPLSSSSTTYVDSNYNVLGSNGGEYLVVTTSAPLPTTARVNDTAAWFNATRYNSSSKTYPIGTTTATFVLEPDTASTALLRIIQVERNTSNAITSTSTTTFRMTPSGELTRLSETAVEGSTSLTATY